MQKVGGDELPTLPHPFRLDYRKEDAYHGDNDHQDQQGLLTCRVPEALRPPSALHEDRHGAEAEHYEYRHAHVEPWGTPKPRERREGHEDSQADKPCKTPAMDPGRCRVIRGPDSALAVSYAKANGREC